jgi:hypothetical protein
MDQQTAQLLAEKLGVVKEYEALQSGDVSSLLAGQSADPLMAMLMSSMLNANSGKEEPIEAPMNYQHELARLKKVIHDLKQQLAAADRMANYISEIFGACSLCWGLNKLCPSCDGKGQPGFAAPVEEDLLAWVRPALKRLGLQINTN